MDPLRDRIFGLLSDLCGPQHELSPDGLRLLGHTLLGVAREHAPSALFAVRDAMPWVAALVELDDGADARTVAEMLAGRGVIRALGPATVARRLEDARRPRASMGSTEAGAEQARLTAALRDLALLDRRLASLSVRSDNAIRDEALDDPRLLAAIVELCHEPNTSEVARRLGEALRPGASPDSGPIALLADLETAWDGGRLRTLSGFAERSRRFEISACDHLRQSGFAEAARAALVYGACLDDEDDLRRRLRLFTVFAEDRTLENLCVALCQARGGVPGYVRGRRPLGALDAWIHFLRGPCHELAEARDITIREATSFAHFSLHLVNFCDIAADPDTAKDSVRKSVMSVEDELKEFALRAQTEGLRDDQVSLDGWDRARWRPLGRGERIAGRLARLAGAWRDGFVEAGLGTTPPRLHEQVLAGWRSELDTLDDSLITLLDERFSDVEIVGARVFEAVSPAIALRLLILSLDGEPCGRIDLSEAASWFLDPTRRSVAREMLQTIPLARLAKRDESAVDCGFAAERCGDTTTVVVRRHPEFEALLVLTADAHVPDDLRRLAVERLEALLGGQPPAPNPTSPNRAPTSLAPGAWING
jgi:hypothetical protein